jgi:hypothetical protein
MDKPTICVIGPPNKRTLRAVRKDTVMKFYKTITLSSLLCGSEMWTLMTQQEKRIKA